MFWNLGSLDLACIRACKGFHSSHTVETFTTHHHLLTLCWSYKYRYININTVKPQLYDHLLTSSLCWCYKCIKYSRTSIVRPPSNQLSVHYPPGPIFTKILILRIVLFLEFFLEFCSFLRIILRIRIFKIWNVWKSSQLGPI